MKLSLSQLASIPERNVDSFYLSTGFQQHDVEKYVGDQLNQANLLRTQMNRALEKAGADHNEETIAVVHFLEDKMGLCQQIINNFGLFKNAAQQRVRPMSIAYAKDIINNL